MTRIFRKTGALVSTAVAGTLLVGAGGIAGAMAADHSEHPGNAAMQADRAALPGADQVLAQARTLGKLSEVLDSVTGLTRAVGAAPQGRPAATELARHAETARDAITSARSAQAKAVKGKAAPADLNADALANLRKSVDALVMTAERDNQKEQDLVAAMNKVVADLVNLTAVTLVDGGLPAADLPGLTPLPTTPQSPVNPVNPAGPASPVTPAVPDSPVPLPLPVSPEAKSHR